MRGLFTCLLILSVLNSEAQELKFKLLAGDFDRRDCPVVVDISWAGLELNSYHYQLYQVEKNREVAVASQIDRGMNGRLSFIQRGELKKGQSRTYVLKRTQDTGISSAITLKKNDKGLRLIANERPILNYQFNVAFPPEGVDSVFRRSGFIHPLWSPGGEVLTRIQAPDHWHHYGIWGPWTMTYINGRKVDFWNLAAGEGTVRFANFLSEVQGPVFTGFSVLQQHIDFGARGADRVAINEILEVDAWNIEAEAGVWMVDYTSTLNSPLDSGILLAAYRYGGGIAFRATERWTKDNSAVLTSEGKDRLHADGTTARWCIVEGESAQGRSGVLFLSHPSNRKFPEPMRVWPVDANSGRGDVYFEFCPIRHEAWELENGKNYSQKYRMVVFDGKISSEEAEQYWQAFAFPPTVHFTK